VSGPVIAEINDVSKRFVVRKEKSIKDRIVNFRDSARFKQDFWALRNVSTTLELGSTVGLVGHNGSGKSTLLKTIGGIIQPTTGQILRRGRLAALLELGAGFHPDLTGRDNVYLNASILGLTRKETDRYFDEIVAFSGIEDFIDTQVKFYSSGMYVRLAFSVAVHVDPDLLLVDEVLAVGDEPFQKKCLEKIAEFQREGRSIVLVSHAAAQVRSLCDRVVVLDHGVVVHDGGTAEGLDVLRASFENSRQSEVASQSPSSVQPSAGPVTLHSVATTLEYENESGVPDLIIELSVEVNKASTNWGAGFTIVSSGGLVIYQFNTFGMVLKMPRTLGKHVVRATVPGLNLGEGEYGVDVGLGTVDGKTIAGAKATGIFAVGRDSQGTGLVQFRPKVVTERAS
jgi:ABC-2 type transport system ATP-binding protein